MRKQQAVIFSENYYSILLHQELFFMFIRDVIAYAQDTFLRISLIPLRVSSILLRVSSGVGANNLVVYVARRNRPIFTRTIKTPKAKKPRKSGLFAYKKYPRIVSLREYLAGSPCWTRTNDTAVNSRMLYRLS